MKRTSRLWNALPPALLLVVSSSCGGDGEEEVGPSTTQEPRPAVEARSQPKRTAPPLPERQPRTEHTSGLVVEIQTAGDGTRAAGAGDRLKIHYDAKTEDGSVVESTHTTGIPFTFRLGEGEVVRGLDRGLVGARAGDELKLFVPASLAYGEKGMGEVPPDADLIFEVRLLRID